MAKRGGDWELVFNEIDKMEQSCVALIDFLALKKSVYTKDVKAILDKIQNLKESINIDVSLETKGKIVEGLRRKY